MNSTTYGKRHFLNDYGFRMKRKSALLIAGILLGTNSFAQSPKIDLHVSNVTLKEALQKISSQSGLDLFFKEDDIKKINHVSLNVSNVKLEAALEMLLSSYPLSYSIDDSVITIMSTQRPSPKKQQTVDLQSKFVKGGVINFEGKPIVGATVRIVASGKTTKTDDKGFFFVQVEKYGERIEISNVGYETVDMPSSGEMLVQMYVKTNVLDEVVSVGYGSMKRKDLTGTISTVNIEEIKNTPFVSIDQALAGKAPGVQVTQADGSPGGVARIRIRGGASLIGGNDPLYIIDGVQVQVSNRYVQTGADIVNPTESLGKDREYANSAIGSSFAKGLNALAGLNINDIESIDILKDASATAIYGSRAANGVVIITTKKGQYNQKPSLEANYYSGINSAISESLLSTQQYKAIMKEGAENLNALRATQGAASDPIANAVLNDANYLGTGDTDWLGLITRTGVSHNMDLSMRGGGTGSRYYTSLSYNTQKGTLVGTDFSRLSGKVNLDNQITPKLKLNTNIDYGYTTNNITNGIYSAALFAPPTFEPFDADGNPKTFQTTTFSLSSSSGVQNPMALLKGINRSNNSMLLGALALEYDIIEDLKFRSTVSANYNSYHQVNYIPSTANISAVGRTSNSSNGGIGSQGYRKSIDMFYENTLTYNRVLNEENRFNVLLGTSWQKSNLESFMASGQGYPDDDFLNGLSSAAVPLPPTATASQNALLSFYLRANYTFKERYLLTFTGRSDASSKFPKNHRVGYFPSFGAAWQLKEEAFLKNVAWIDMLKLRVSAGKTGTQNLGDNLFYTLYTSGSYAGANALNASQLGNDRIKWESTLQKDAGLDFAFFDNRLTGTVGYYQKNTSDLLMTMPVAESSGFTYAMVNIADISNKGLEVDVRGDVIRNKNFKWNLGINISGNRSNVGKISTDIQNPNIPGSNNPMQNAEALIGNTFLREGYPVGLIYGNVYKGAIKNQAELEAYRQNSFYAQVGALQNLAIGYPMYDVFTDGDFKGFFKRDIIGYAEPKYYGGITNSFEYKGFGLTTLFTFSKGGDILYLPDLNALGLGDRTNKNARILEITNNAQNRDENKPTLILGESNRIGVSNSNLQVHDASYLKLKSLTLNYSLPKTVLEKLKLNTALIYFSASNIFAITKYPGPDPEVSNDPYSLINGYTDAATYPSVRQFTLGARIGF
ncbi:MULTISPECIES: SusC/RagA family TonB-linked outer membrane protein [Sphingobacterium]|uniref:SusC/RagA family TonB-linked outer membrane protein n=1 Tax=Sphingobacterium TaxID=28453 RepID=UPI00257AE33F|nr:MULTISPECIES: SusC/RagA family TonB-linked outer membrane protein [Sphingobacterium]